MPKIINCNSQASVLQWYCNDVSVINQLNCQIACIFIEYLTWCCTSTTLLRK